MGSGPSALVRDNSRGLPDATYAAGLDGLRALAVLSVVAFHGGVRLLPGGFVGVSLFFTLSGFLITRLLLSEWQHRQRIGLRGFWERRLRRLAPAALLTLGVIMLASPHLMDPVSRAGLRVDVLAALAYVANWRFLFQGHHYADLFAAPSPVLHFWSLAIEEQLYVLFPLLVVAVGRRRLGPVLCALIAGSVALGWLLYTPGGSTNAAYYGTFVRGGELFVGALLAVLVMSRRHMWRPGITKTAGVVALVGMLWAWSTVRQDDALLYRGGFVVHAVLTAIVILSAMQPGPVRMLLSVPPLRALGAISYGVYLYHWPVLVWWDA